MSKPKSAWAEWARNRCTHRSSSGRQCRLAIFDPQSGLYANHHADLKQNERADVASILFRDAQEVQTAQGINYSLRCLDWLAAKNSVSPRRAKVLAYICGLLLRTLPLIAEERRAGITWSLIHPSPTQPRGRHDESGANDDLYL